MLDLIKKAMLIGIGAADLAKERVEKFADELVKRGEMAESEKAKFVREMTDKMIKKAEGLREKVDRSTEKVASRMRTAKADEVAALRQQVEGLTKKLEKLEKKMEPKKAEG